MTVCADIVPFEPDPFDPRFLDFPPEQDRRIYWRDTGISVLVDEKAYFELIRYAWNAFTTRTAFKTYFRRTASDGRTTILLHREVLRIHGRLPPDDGQRWVGDHKDGNEFDCRIGNLRWATYSVNSLNRKIAA